MADRAAILCGRCGYDVRGLPSRVCPECGGNLRVVGTRRRRPPLDRRGWIILWSLAMLAPLGGVNWLGERYLQVETITRVAGYAGGPDVRVGDYGNAEVAVLVEVEASRPKSPAAPYRPHRAAVAVATPERAERAFDRNTPLGSRVSGAGEIDPDAADLEVALRERLAADPRITDAAAASLAPTLAAVVAAPGSYSVFASGDGYWASTRGSSATDRRPSRLVMLASSAVVALWVAGVLVIRRRVRA